MSTEYYNSQWQIPNEANKSKRANYSLNFTGSEEINISDLSNIPTGGSSRTVSAWFNSSYSGTGEPVIVSYGARANAQMFNIMLKGGSGADAGRLRFVGYNRDHTFTTADLRDEQWHHVAMTYNGTIVEAFLDGSSVGNFTPSSALNTGTSFFNIGVEWDHWQGQISQLCVFDYVLSTSQVTTLYGTGSVMGDPMSLSPAPQAYYPLSNSVWNGSSYITPNNAVQDYVFDFNGASDRVYGPTGVFSGQTATTISFWVNADALSGVQNLFANGGYPYFRLNGTNIETTWPVSGNNFKNFASGMTAGKWHLFVFKWESGSKYQIYIDNDLKGESTSTITGSFPSSNTSSLELANGVDNLDLQGKMSNFKVWNVALTTSELTTLYNYGSPIRTLANIPQSSNLKVWYKLDASEIYDNSTTEWEIENSSNPSIYNNFMDFNNFYMKVYPIGSGKNGAGGLTLPDTYTISWWAKTSLSSSGGFFEGELHTGGDSAAWGNIFRYNSISGGKYRLYNAGSPVDVTSDIANGAWHHILLTYDSSTTTVTVYTDNVQTFTSSSRNYGTGNNIGRIGSGSDGNSYYTGDMSNISIWDGVVTNSQRDELYNNGAPKDLTNNSNYSNLKHWYIFNSQTTGTRTLNDQKGSNNLLAYSQHTPAFGFINTLAGNSSGMSRSNLVQSNLSRVFNNRTFAFHGGYINATGLSATTQSGLLNPSGSSFSLSIWFRNVSSSYGGILSKRDGSGSTTYPPTSFGMFKDDNSGSYSGISAYAQKLVFVFTEAVGSYDATNSIGSAETIQTNKWYNVVITHTPGNTKMYLNGSVDSTSTSITKSSFPDDYFTLSACFTNGLNWRGALSNLSFFDTVLSASEVKEIWNNGLPGDLNQHSKVDQLKDWIGIGNNYSGFTSGNTCLINYKKAPNMYGNIGALYSSTWNTIGTTGFGDSTGTSSGFTIPSTTVTNIVTNAPYSDKNAVSVDMWNQYSASQPNATITSGISNSTPQAT